MGQTSQSYVEFMSNSQIVSKINIRNWDQAT